MGEREITLLHPLPLDTYGMQESWTQVSQPQGMRVGEMVLTLAGYSIG